MPDLPFQGAVKLRDIKGRTNMYDSELIIEETGLVHGENESFHNIAGLSYPTAKDLIEKDVTYQIIREVDILQEIHKKKMKQKACQMKIP